MCVMTHDDLRVQEFFLFFKERKNAKIPGGFQYKGLAFFEKEKED